jgi:hypothetical protein
MTLDKILKNKYVSNDNNLSSLIFNNIKELEERKIRVRRYIYMFSGSLSFIFLIFALSYTFNQLYQSGFYEYLSLVFSDISLAFSFWEDLIVSLISTLPMFSILISFTFVFTTLIFFKKFFLDLKRPLLIA